jgi:hypothetical protein
LGKTGHAGMAFEFKAILEAHPHGGDLSYVVLVRHNV